MQVTAWHAYYSPVFHNNDECGAGERIAGYRRIQGRGGRPLCMHCAHLNTANPFDWALAAAPRPVLVGIPPRRRLTTL